MSASASLQLLPTGWARVHPEPAIEWRRPALLRAHPDTSVLPVMANAQYEQFRADIVERGVQEPLKVSADGLLLDGRERLRAASELGLAQVPVRVVRPADPFEYILACALKRKQLTPSQRAALAVERDTYQQARASAEIRRLANLRQSAEVASLPPRGKTRDSAARWAGVSPRTVQDAATVKAHDPGLFAQVKAGAIAADQAARRVRRRLRDEAIGQPPPPPRGPFQLVYADPPWQLGNPDSRYAPENHYPTLPLEEILALEIPACSVLMVVRVVRVQKPAQSRQPPARFRVAMRDRTRSAHDRKA